MADGDTLEQPTDGQMARSDELMDRGDELMDRGEELIVGGDELMERGEELMVTLRDELHLHYQEQAEHRRFMSDLVSRFERTAQIP